jgi:hypothetical protein
LFSSETYTGLVLLSSVNKLMLTDEKTVDESGLNSILKTPHRFTVVLLSEGLSTTKQGRLPGASEVPTEESAEESISTNQAVTVTGPFPGTKTMLSLRVLVPVLVPVKPLPRET